nr:MAG TPA: UL49 family protein [Inoviridae sp.]
MRDENFTIARYAGYRCGHCLNFAACKFCLPPNTSDIARGLI